MDLDILLIPQANKYLGTKSFKLHDNEEKAIGRNGSKSDIMFNSKVISRKHAYIIFKNSKVYIRDAGSSSGTFINTIRLSPMGRDSDWAEIRDGDAIQFGETFQQNDNIHPCVQCKMYLAKQFNGDLIGPEIASNIEEEFEEMVKFLDEKSNILAIFEARKTKSNGSIKPGNNN
eukprot:NODE_223_length_12360_cov_0.266862.p6 type:complete len:174 gc:universal NODE_223_length_12360_cov_0.266862:5167-5688(+)